MNLAEDDQAGNVIMSHVGCKNIQEIERKIEDLLAAQ